MAVLNMESCQFETPIQSSRNGFDSVYRSWQEQRESGPNVPVHHPHSELYSRSTVGAANSYPYTACPQTIDNLSWTKDSTANCSYTSSSNQNRINLSHSILPVRGTAPSAILDGNFPHHQPVNSIHGLHRAPPTSVQASIHGSAFTQSVPRTATKWPTPCAMATNCSGHAESEPNNAIHRSPCTGEWQYSSQHSGRPTHTSTTGYLNGFGAPARSSFMHEIQKGRKTSNCMISNSPCGACGNILCPKSHQMCPNELTVACPRSPPCYGLDFPAYASRPAPPTPAVAAPRSEALVGYSGWPASAPPLCFYGKLVSAGKKRDFPGNRGVTESPNVGRGLETNETVNSTIQVSMNGHRDSKPTELPTYYRNKGSNLCNICGRSYARPSTLKTHLRTHSGEKPYRCRTCGKAFSQTANLTAHMRTHSGEKPFRCAMCHRQFSQSSSVTTHMRTHSGERPYSCAYCKKAFADSSTLTKHLRIHSGDRPYECRTCLLRFSQSGNLTRHMKVHQHLREDCFGTN